ncbi:Hypothetical predicted protein [Olea europaea subsp. europaea]|uniref:Uncharacterized protein n=1 Tax=Olea europaea subsp. europaea TaxID=158383 RepID=A0A8S0PPZ8_OLEEU|nr:Hypothetical predicted protein [Olea europaea subsp. europaea]
MLGGAGRTKTGIVIGRRWQIAAGDETATQADCVGSRRLGTQADVDWGRKDENMIFSGENQIRGGGDAMLRIATGYNATRQLVSAETYYLQGSLPNSRALSSSLSFNAFQHQTSLMTSYTLPWKELSDHFSSLEQDLQKYADAPKAKLQ